MRWVFPYIAATICLATMGCGSSRKGSDTTSSDAQTTATVARVAEAPVDATADADKDNDVGTRPPKEDTNNNEALDFGHAASNADKQAITALVKHYYKAAQAEDGTTACSLIYSILAEAVPEDYGQSPPGPAYSVGKTCPAVTTLQFKHFHRQLALEVPLLQVTRVRLQEHHGWAILAFGTLPEREISVTREGHVWKMAQLLDGALP